MTDAEDAAEGQTRLLDGGRAVGPLLRLARERFSGALLLRSARLTTTFVFMGGAVVFVEDEEGGQSFGQGLLDRGVVTPRDFARVLGLATESLSPFPDLELAIACHRERLVDPGALRGLVHTAVQERLIRVASLWDCSCEEDSLVEPPEVARLWAQAPAPHIYRGVRTFFDDGSVAAVREEFAAHFARLMASPKELTEHLALEAGETRLVRALSVERSVADAIGDSRMSELHGWQLITTLAVGDMVVFSKERPSETAAQSVVRDRRRLSPPASLPEAELASEVSPSRRAAAITLSGAPSPVRERVSSVDASTDASTDAAPSRPLAETLEQAPGAARSGATASLRSSAPAPTSRPARATWSGSPSPMRGPPAGRARGDEPSGHLPPSATSTMAASADWMTSSVPPAPAAPAGASHERAAERGRRAADRLGRELRMRRPPARPEGAAATKVTSPTVTDEQRRARVQALMRMRGGARRDHEPPAQPAGFDPELQLSRGRSLLEAEAFDRAFELFTELQAHARGEAIYEAYGLYAYLRAHPKSSRQADVVARLRELLSGYRKDAQHAAFAHHGLAHAAFADGDERGAERLFRRAVELDRRNKDAVRYLRILERRLAEPKEPRSQKIFGISIGRKR